MKRKRHHRAGSDGPVPQPASQGTREAEGEAEDRLEQLLEAAGAAMPEASDGEPEPKPEPEPEPEPKPKPDEAEAVDDSLHEHSDHPVSDSVAGRTAPREVDMAIRDADAVEEELALMDLVPNMRRSFSFSSLRFGCCGIRGVGSLNLPGVWLHWSRNFGRICVLRFVDPVRASL